jgi:predicted metalloendopeptidase
LHYLYSSLTDYSKRNTLETTPLIPLLDLINSIDSIEKMSEVLGALTVLDLNPLLSIQVCQDLKNRDKYIFNITEPNCILPSKEYYSELEYTEIRSKYLEFISKCLNKLNITSIDSKTIYNFEKTIVGLNADATSGKIVAIGFYGNNIYFDYAS